MSNRRKLSNPDPAARLDPLLDACLALIPRLGASSFEMRYSEPEHSGSPVVWMAIAEFSLGDRKVHEVGAGLTPTRAGWRLVETLVDGGQCAHCKKPTGITEDFDSMPLSEAVCWYQFDPELKLFRRGCE